MNTVNQIDVHQLNEKITKEKVQILDIRDSGSYAMGHISGARHLTDANVDEVIRDLDKDATLIVYCYHGISSQGAAAYLSEQGFQDVYSMAGGFEAWRTTYPIEQ